MDPKFHTDGTLFTTNNCHRNFTLLKIDTKITVSSYRKCVSFPRETVLHISKIFPSILAYTFFVVFFLYVIENLITMNSYTNRSDLIFKMFLLPIHYKTCIPQKLFIINLILKRFQTVRTLVIEYVCLNST